MKILFVNEYIYPNVVSGAELSMQALAEGLKTKGEEIIFFGPNLSNKKNDFYKNLKIFYFPFPKKIKPYMSLSPVWFNNPIFWFYSAIFLIFACLKEKINLIHLHGKYLLPAAIISKFILRIPVVVTVRDYKFLCPLALCLIEQRKICDFKYFLTKEIRFYLSSYEKRRNLLNKSFLIFRILIGKLLQEILLRFLKSADKIICVSQAVLEIYHQKGIKRKKLLKIYNLPPSYKKLSSMNKKIVLYVGKLSFGKGTDILIKAMKKVRERLPKVKLVLVGKKSPSINSIPDFVSYYPPIPHEKVKRFYHQASLFVLPSRWPEPLSRSTLEAMSVGLPLVVSNRGGNKEVVIDGANGYIVRPEPGQLAKKILFILQNQQMRKKMARKSLVILKTHFSRVKILEQHLALYNSLLT